MNIKLGFARTILIGPILDSTGVAKTDEVVASILCSKNGGDPAALDAVDGGDGVATLTHKACGYYRLALTVTDVSALGCMEFMLNSTTNTMPVARLNVMTALAWDALYAASGGEIPASVATGKDIDAAALLAMTEVI